jgi:hypothetical protein
VVCRLKKKGAVPGTTPEASGTNPIQLIIIIVIVVIAAANTDLPADFSARKLSRMNIRIAQVRTQKSLETGKVPGGDALRGYGQNVGRGPRAADTTAVVWPIRARRPASTTAEENDHRAVNLRLAKVNVGCLRRTGKASPRNCPRNAGFVLAERPGEFTGPVNQLRRYLTKSRQLSAVPGGVIMIGTYVENGWHSHYSQNEHKKHNPGCYFHRHCFFLPGLDCEWSLLKRSVIA